MTTYKDVIRDIITKYAPAVGFRKDDIDGLFWFDDATARDRRLRVALSLAKKNNLPEYSLLEQFAKKAYPGLWGRIKEEEEELELEEPEEPEEEDGFEQGEKPKGRMSMTTEEIKAIASRAAEAVLSKVPGETTEPETGQEEELFEPDIKKMVEWIKDETPTGGNKVYDFQCETKPEPLKEWFATEFGPDDECRPCRMLPLASMYLGLLQKVGETKEAQELEQVYESQDILTVAEFMDKIKVRAKERLRQALEELDCFTQSYEEVEE